MGISGRNDMWKSEDRGQSWTPVALASPWTARHSFGFVQMPGGTRQGRLLILGGSDGRIQHDVWASDDTGESWHIMKFTHVHEMVYRDVEDRASWSPRYGMGATADREGMLTICGGGDDGADTAFSREVWQIESPPPNSVPWYLKRTTDDRLNVDRSAGVAASGRACVVGTAFSAVLHRRGERSLYHWWPGGPWRLWSEK